MTTVSRTMLTLLACVLAPFAMAHDGMNMKMPAGTELGASAAIDSHGRLWVVDAADGHVRLRHSEDDGKTLSAPVMVNTKTERIYAEGENRPKIAFGTKGEIYVNWSQPRAEPWTGFVRFARSLDHGKTFSTPITVHHDRHEITHRFDAMAVDGHGRIVIAWIDKRDLIAAEASGKPYLGAAVYYSWSNDQGTTFVPERKLVDESCECCRIALSRTPQGDVAAFFRSIYGDNIRDHAYAVLRTDGQPSHATRATFSQWKIAGCPHHGPGLAIGSDSTRHAVWYEASHKPTIWYGQLDPGHPPRHPLVVATVGDSHADVAVQGKQVWIVWNQVSAAGYALMARHSSDHGLHFAAARELAHSDGAVGSPQLLLKPNAALVGWNTDTGYRVIAMDVLP